MNITEGPGQALLAAREQMKVTTREIGDALNLPVQTIEAIEANDFDGLPSLVFARGYVRAYAKLLELDPDPLVAMYPTHEISPQTPTGHGGNRWQELQQFIQTHRNRVLPVGGAVAGLLLLIVLVASWPSPEEPAIDVAPAEPSAAEQTLGDTVNAGVNGGAPVGAVVQGPQTDDPSALVEPTSEAEVALRIGEGDDRLLFRFSDQCWVEVRSTTGQILYSDLGRTRQTLELVGRAPFSVLLGYAPGVTMAFNNEDVALAPHTRNNVATLVLGQ